MADVKSPARQAADRIGNWISRGFANYFEHWQDWLVPVIVAVVVLVGASLCCFFPYFLVFGPVQCGLYYCAFSALRNEPVDTTVFNRTWDAPGSSILASLFIVCVNLLPVLLMYGIFALGMCLLTAYAAPAAGPNPGGGAVPPQFAAPREEFDDRDPFAEEPHLPQEWGQAGPGGGGRQPGGPAQPPDALLFGGILLFYVVMFVFMFLFWIWQLWFTTRMMFVFPLIAHRGLGAGEAIRTSWRETRVRFWELLAVNFVAGIISMAGVYAMYVGALFTIPMGVTILAVVYLDRFAAPASSEPGPVTSEPAPATPLPAV